MEKKIGAEDKIAVISVLSEAQELANELKRQLLPPTSDELKQQLCDKLLEQILSHYDKAIGMLDGVAMIGDGVEGLDQTSKDHPHVHASKKRKTLPIWSKQMRVQTGSGFEGQPDDGYNWRKYGQKIILNANHPRAYYRCTHRNTQGCLATKLVQRMDDDPSVFEVSYKGKHSCIQERGKFDKGNVKKEITIQSNVKIENYQQRNIDREDHASPAFSVPLTPFGHDSGEAMFHSGQGSLASSESCLSLSQCGINDFAIGCDLPLEFDFGEIVSNVTPIPDFPLGDWDFLPLEFDFGEIVSNVTPIPDFLLGDWDFPIEEMDFNVLQFLEDIQ